MADTESNASSSSGSGESAIEYQCKTCNQIFTEDQKEAHRAVHKQEDRQKQRESRGKKLPPVPRSVPGSEVTLFDVVPVKAVGKKAAAPAAKKRRRVSRKKYNKNVKTKERFSSG